MLKIQTVSTNSRLNLSYSPSGNLGSDLSPASLNATSTKTNTTACVILSSADANSRPGLYHHRHYHFMMDILSSSDVESVSSEAPAMTSPPSSPPPVASPKSDVLHHITENSLLKEEREARDENRKAEEKRAIASRKPRRKKKAETKSEREAKARELDELLMKSAAFSDILTKKTQVLGRVGSSLDGKTLGEHNLQMAKQPKCMVGGTMRDYQLEGLTWMFEICSQGMSGILADEMGLGLQLPLDLHVSCDAD